MSWRARLISDWLYFFSEAALNFRRGKATHFLSLLTITVALAILGIFLSITFNLNNLVRKMENDIEVTAFLEEKADYQLVQEKIRGLTGVDQVSFVSKEAALEEFTADEELKELIDIIGVNPLPASVRIKVSRDDLAESKMDQLVRQVERVPGVEEVRYGRQWLSQFFKVIELLRKISFALGITLLVGVLFIITNTIRLTVYLNSDKIVIMRLVGATENFIRGPYLVQGISQGLLGGVLAVSLLKLGFFLLFEEQVGITFLPLSLSFIIIVLGIALGGGASFAAVRKFLPATFN